MIYLYYHERVDARRPGPEELPAHTYRMTVRYPHRIGKWRGVWGYTLYSEFLPVEEANKLGLSRGRPCLWDIGKVRFRELALSVREEEMARLNPD